MFLVIYSRSLFLHPYPSICWSAPFTQLHTCIWSNWSTVSFLVKQVHCYSTRFGIFLQGVVMPTEFPSYICLQLGSDPRPLRQRKLATAKFRKRSQYPPRWPSPQGWVPLVILSRFQLESGIGREPSTNCDSWILKEDKLQISADNVTLLGNPQRWWWLLSCLFHQVLQVLNLAWSLWAKRCFNVACTEKTQTLGGLSVLWACKVNAKIRRGLHQDNFDQLRHENSEKPPSYLGLLW